MMMKMVAVLVVLVTNVYWGVSESYKSGLHNYSFNPHHNQVNSVFTYPFIENETENQSPCPPVLDHTVRNWTS